MSDNSSIHKPVKRTQDDSPNKAWQPVAWHDIERAFTMVAAQPCPYLPGRKERKLLAPLVGDEIDSLSVMNRAGYRRSHDLIYRPACIGCDACKSIRVPIATFAPTKSQKRIIKRNQELMFSVVPNRVTQEHWELFHDYVAKRHFDGDMVNMNFQDLVSMVEDTSIQSSLFEWRDPKDATLIAVCLVDHLNDGFSAVYSFFDPSQSKRSLGVAIILAMVEIARSVGHQYLYLGYWVKGSPKMDYKASYGPAQIFEQGQWINLEKRADKV